MKLNVSYHHLRAVDAPHALVAKHLQPLNDRLRIDEARVRLDRSPHHSPSFSVRVHLVTPGVDVVAIGRDHTLAAALRKVMAHLETKIRERTKKPFRPQVSGLSGHGLPRVFLAGR